MVKNFTFLVLFLCGSMYSTFAQITFESFEVTVNNQTYYAGNTILLDNGETYSFQFVVNLVKPSNHAIGMSDYEIVVLNSSNNENSQYFITVAPEAWSVSDKAYYTYNGNFSFYSATNDKKIYAKVTTSSGVVYRSNPINLKVTTPVVASAGSAKFITCPGSAVLDGSASGGNGSYTYKWSPSTGLSSTTVAKPIASPTSTTDYTLKVTDSDGKTDTDYVTVYVETADFTMTGPANFYVACPGGRSTYRYSISSIPSGAQSVAWSTNYGIISRKYYNSAGLVIAVDVTDDKRGGGPLEPIAMSKEGNQAKDNAGVFNWQERMVYENITVSATMNFGTCGSKTNSFNSLKRFPVCAPKPLSLKTMSTEKAISGFEVYPNPSNGKNIRVHNAGKTYSLNVVSTTSNKVIFEKSNIENDISLPALEPGIYLLKLTTNDGVEVKRIIIN